jgi:pantetheine-phosphate adenylyltransferase
MKRITIYAGSFDPLTNGHLDVLKAALAVADTIYAAIGVHPGKKPLFSLEERIELIERAARAEFGADAERIKVISFDGLVIDAARKHGASTMIRGLRDGTDLDYEMQMAGMNETLCPHHYRHTCPPDSQHGRRYPPLRSGRGRWRARRKIR